MTFELPGGSATGTASVGGASATPALRRFVLRRFALARRDRGRLLGLNAGGSVAFLT